MASSDDLAKTFLVGPMFKKGRPPRPYLEAYSQEWRAGAQAIGYREAAATLLDVVIEGERSTSRTLLHPILFLYRHSIELRMKRIIQEYQPDTPPAPVHPLDKLWTDCKKVIIQYLPHCYFKRIDKLIAELHSVDPDGQTFRYATRGKRPIQIKFDEIDLIHLRTKMDELDIAFEGIVTEIDEAMIVLAEMNR